MIKKMVSKIKKDNERGARYSLIEELFYDFNRGRKEVYLMNFIRGIFFGFGTVLGGTVLVALIIWILGQFVGFPGIGDFIKGLIALFQRH